MVTIEPYRIPSGRYTYAQAFEAIELAQNGVTEVGGPVTRWFNSKTGKEVILGSTGSSKSKPVIRISRAERRKKLRDKK